MAPYTLALLFEGNLILCALLSRLWLSTSGSNRIFGTSSEGSYLLGDQVAFSGQAPNSIRGFGSRKAVCAWRLGVAGLWGADWVVK